MRIITGSARGTNLETLEGTETRPTAGSVKEAIFSMIQFEIEGREVLDLFAGSGQLALEALSRGASKAVLADNNPEAVKIIKRNAQKTHFYEKCVVITADWKNFIKSNAGRMKFDIIFLDPPYPLGIIPEILDRLIAADMIKEKGVIVCESDSREPFCHEGLTLRKHAKYGRVFVTLLEKTPTDDFEPRFEND